MKHHPPKIAIVSSYFPSREEPYRGQSTYQALRLIPDRADWCGFVPFLRYPDWYNPRQARYRRMDVTRQRPPDLAAQYFEYTTMPGIGRPFNGYLVYRELRAAVKAFQPDLILNYWLYPDGYAAVKIAKDLGVPVIVASIGSDLRRIEDPFTRMHTRWTLRNADHLITVSHELAQQAAALGGDPGRTTVILNGYDGNVYYPGDQAAERARLGVAADAELVFYLGSLIPTKGLAELMDAFIALARRRPKLRLVCGGEGPLRSELERRAAEAGLADRFQLVGQLSGAAVRGWMVAADLFCLPSYSEGCPNVVIEALACGRAVVATDVGGIPELVKSGSNGLLVPPRNAAALEAGLDQALGQHWNSESVAATYRRDWHAVAEETWSVCTAVLERGLSSGPRR